MRVYLSSDHAGFALKESLAAWLRARPAEEALEVVDLGPATAAPCDYPERAWALAEAVAGDEGSRGVLVCGTGLGVSMAANRHPRIRAALAHDAFTAELARRHNDAQVLCLGARVVGEGVARHALEAFLRAGFEGGRHAARVAQLGALGARGAGGEA
ncbi:MAG: ribose 5-phosphate isomerase B [Deltaproteobacteria bacterium]|nr:ribose 5-phosphate isomerase B [Deltaproteobacteria bacterium]